jgi:2-polyprenyl-3-methyl-5-hydroxy-6-metoxy-1,4-benzoquinol methylase
MSVYCPQCKRESRRYFRTKDYNQRISADDFDYYSCPGCGVIHLFPVPINLGEYYRGDYPPYALPASSERLTSEADKVRFRIELVQKFVLSGRLLEIGPSFGAFAFLAKQAGFKVEAIEMDARCCQFLTDVVGVRCIHTSDVIAALKTVACYDVIVLWHNIEHLPEPWTTLQMLSDRLLPGGILVISTPNPEALQFRVFGRFWVNVDAPRHLELIPAQLLIRFMQDRGLRTVLATTTDKDGLTLNRYGWHASMVNVFTFLRIFRPWPLKTVFTMTTGKTDLARNGAGLSCDSMKRSFPSLSKLIRSVMGRVITSVLNPIERKGWRGSAYTIVFRKAHSD